MSKMLFNVMKTIGSGLSAQRRRMEAIANNIANAETTRTQDGGPYRRKSVVIKEITAETRVPSRNFRTSLRLATTSPTHMSGARAGITGAETVEVPEMDVRTLEDSPARVKVVYDPHHPDADSSGYVAYPDINPVEEMVDMMTASRAYEANIAAMSTLKSMVKKALEM
ncbi:MAG: flagellar basal body rod protein FlgC [bacterium]|jgi:flagellar basal-body rod protein FlgC